MGKGFNLADVLGEAAKLDTGIDGREQIEYIDIDLIDPDPDNFYELSDIDGLAANIELVGLQQPLRVRENPSDSSRYIVVSGHRRREALKLLVREGKETYRHVACIREAEVKSVALRELRLIYANSDTRTMTAAEIAKQAERVEALLYQLKEEGVEFPGRMRDHVAEACKVSKSKLSRLKVIRENLDEALMPYWERGELPESVAYAFAQNPNEIQQLIMKHSDVTKLTEWGVNNRVDDIKTLSKRTCKKSESGECTHCEEIYAYLHDGSYSYKPCKYNKCCSSCDKLSSCKHACPYFADRAKKLKEEKREAKRQEKLAQEERNLLKIRKIEELWTRFGFAREQANKSVKDTFEALDKNYYPALEQKHIDKEYCRDDFTPDSYLPYGYVRLPELVPVIKAAEFFNCSADYLLGLTDELRPTSEPAPAEALSWNSGLPPKTGYYAAVFNCDGYKMQKLAWFNTCLGKFYFDKSCGHSIEAECIGWYPIPQDEE